MNSIGASLLDGYPIGGLADFETLKRLTLDSRMLTGQDDDEIERDGFQSQQHFIDMLPTSIEEITLLECGYNDKIPAQVSALISRKTKLFPTLKKMDLGREKIQYPYIPSPPEPFKYPGFKLETATTLLAEFEEAGVEMVIKTMSLQRKDISYLQRNDERQLDSIEERGGMKFPVWEAPVQFSHLVPHPYTDYHKLCEEHGCDAATGRRPGSLL